MTGGRTRKPRPPGPFFITPDSPVQQSVRESALEAIVNWPIDEPLKVTLSRAAATRRNVQNALLWVWNEQIADQWAGHHARDVHAKDKLEILLPMMQSWDDLREEYYLIRTAVRASLSYEHSLYIADRCVRSSTLNVRQFAEFLSDKQRIWTERGFVLEVHGPQYDHALGSRAA